MSELCYMREDGAMIPARDLIPAANLLLMTREGIDHFFPKLPWIAFNPFELWLSFALYGRKEWRCD